MFQLQTNDTLLGINDVNSGPDSTTYSNELNNYANDILNQNTAISSYYARTNRKTNPYAGKNVIFTDGTICYVTATGIVKPYNGAPIGINGCPSESSAIKLSVPYSEQYVYGATIPLTPPLVVGSPMVSGQECGKEGSNVYVNTPLSNDNPTYTQCFQDSQSMPLMTFIGGSPPPVTVAAILNGNFNQPAIGTNTYLWVNDSTTVPNWIFSAYLCNQSSEMGYPMPPNGPQYVSIQNAANIIQIVTLTAGVTYTLTGYACGRPCCDDTSVTNPINIVLNGETVYTISPADNTWEQFQTPITVTTTGSYNVMFIGTWDSTNRSTALQGITLFTEGTVEAAGTYSFNQCKQSAIMNGSRYFALQNVNTNNSLGYCGVSNNLQGSSNLGTSITQSASKVLWSSNTTNSSGSSGINSALLTGLGDLSIIDSTGLTIYSTTTGSAATPSNYFGCYRDRGIRAMTAYNKGSQQYNNSQCQQIAQSNGYKYYGLQNSTSGTTAQCFLSNNLAGSTQYGKAGNCTQISDGSYSGGGWSNALYNANLAQSIYYLTVEDNGNMCIFRGSNPNDNQGQIWCSNTGVGSGLQSNPAYAAINGKYGKNWMASGSTLFAGDFIGSPSGKVALIMMPTGALSLYTYIMSENCSKMVDGNMGGGILANAIYDLGQTPVTSAMGDVGYINQNDELFIYPSDNVEFANTYTKITDTTIIGNDITGTSYGSATEPQCKQTCNSLAACSGYVFSPGSSICYPKTGITSSNISYSNGYNVYMRNKQPIATAAPSGVDNNVRDIDSVRFSRYLLGTENFFSPSSSANKEGFSNIFGLGQQLTGIGSGGISGISGGSGSNMYDLANDMSLSNTSYMSNLNKAFTQIDTNNVGIKKYIHNFNDIQQNNIKLQQNNASLNNILDNGKLNLNQSLYKYLIGIGIASSLAMLLVKMS